MKRFRSFYRSNAYARSGRCPVCSGPAVRATCGSKLCMEIWVTGYVTGPNLDLYLSLPENKPERDVRWPMERIRRRFPRAADRAVRIASHEEAGEQNDHTDE